MEEERKQTEVEMVVGVNQVRKIGVLISQRRLTQLFLSAHPGHNLLSNLLKNLNTFNISKNFALQPYIAFCREFSIYAKGTLCVVSRRYSLCTEGVCLQGKLRGKLSSYLRFIRYLAVLYLFSLYGWADRKSWVGRPTLAGFHVRR